MSSFADDQAFAESLAKGSLAEITFERLAVNSGWWVKYRGDQYHLPISPKKKSVEGGDGTPDFELSRSIEFTKSIMVEVKFQSTLMRRGSAHRKGQEDFRVVLSPTGYSVYPERRQSELNIADEDWNLAVRFLAKIFGKTDVAL